MFWELLEVRLLAGLPIWLSLLASLVLGMVASLIVTLPIIAWLKRRQFGKAIRVDGPDHAAKAGTPTMGGLGMLGVVLLGGLTLSLSHGYLRSVGLEHFWNGQRLESVALVLGGLMVFGALGLVDDLAGLARRSGAKELGVGLGARQMLALQVLVALGLSGLALRFGTDIIVGDLGLLPILLLTTLALVGTVNGVNLSDGLDGLAAGLLALVFGATALLFGFTALPEIVFGGIETDGLPAIPIHLLWKGDIWRQLFVSGPLDLALLAALAAGACLGFLWYNRHPARVFMGNVASMGLGGALAMMFIVSGLWWLLPIVGAVFVAEVLSVIIQVGYFKWSGGKRVFRMAPFHHHYEKGGMHETQVVRRFWIAGALSGLLAIALFVYLVA